MGQTLSKKVLQRHVTEANKTEKILQLIFSDTSLRLSVLTGKVLCDPLEVIADFVGSVKYLLIYNPASVEKSEAQIEEGTKINDIMRDSETSTSADHVNTTDTQAIDSNVDGTVWRVVPSSSASNSNNNSKSSSSQHQQLKKKVLTCKNFLLLRRLCYEYEHVVEIGSQLPSSTNNAVFGQEPSSGHLQQPKAGEKKVDSFDPDECSICMDASIDIVLPCLHGYCSGCWDDWSSHSSTCPHCRGEIKISLGEAQAGQVQGQSEEDKDETRGGGDIWQYESWDESDMHTQLETLRGQLRQFVIDLPLDLTTKLMTSHCILSPPASSSSRSGGRGGDS